MGKRRVHRVPEAAVPIILPPSVREELGADANALLEALAQPSPTSIRLNPRKPIAIAGEAVPWCANGRYLDERPVFTLDPLLHAGCYYVQEASSMLLEQALMRSGLLAHDIIALDLCAAPGGKSTHIASLLSSGSMLVCNEPVRSRQAALMENVWKHGCANTMITRSEPRDLDALGEFFDLIMVDAPCSGEGMFRKDPFARQQWNERLVEHCAVQQNDILHHAWNALKPGGALIYCTCTWERRENEAQVKALIERSGEFVPLELDPAWGIVNTDFGHRCYPHRLRGEGFFIALIRKEGTLKRKTPGTITTKDEHDEPRSWLAHSNTTDLIAHDGILHAITSQWREEVASIREHLRQIAPGIPIAERKGDGWKPHAALALNARLNEDSFATIDPDREQALRYLRGETMNDWNARGVRLVRYEGHALGWAFGAGNRWNNGWPDAWRIRMR